MSLRDYQDDAIKGLRAGILDGHKHQVLSAPTGSGKTHIGMALVQEAAAKRSRTAFICDRIQLVDQTSALFEQYGINHGVIQAKHWRFDPSALIQICSAQTLSRRGIPEDLRLIIVDECHTLYKTTVDFLKEHSEIITVGLTATPFTKGLGLIFSNVVNVTTTDKLIALGWLSPLRAYAARQMDMVGAATKFDGEWKEEEMEKRGVEIIGDVVATWKQKTLEHFSGPVKTLVFSATVDHGIEICRQFQEEGFNFQQISYKGGNDKKRRDLIEEFRKPDSDIVGLVSCEVLAKGFDVPDVKCGISCRPYRKSLSSHIQQIGRVMRQHVEKEFALWLDHSGNFLRFYGDTGDFFANGIDNLKGGKLDSSVRPEPTEKERKQLLCGSCGFILLPGMTNCPSCGWARPKTNNVEHLAGDVHEINLKSKVSEKSPLNDFLKDRDRAWRQICEESLRRKKGDVETASRFAAAQFKSIYGVWPPRKLENTTPEPCNPMLYRKIKQLVIAYAKRRAA